MAVTCVCAANVAPRRIRLQHEPREWYRANHLREGRHGRWVLTVPLIAQTT